MSSATVNCPQCSAELQPGMLRCRACGTRLPKSSSAAPPPAVTPAPPKAAPLGTGAVAAPVAQIGGGTAFQLDAMLGAMTPPPPVKTDVPVPPAANVPTTASQETGRNRVGSAGTAAVPVTPNSRGASSSGVLSSVSSVLEVPAAHAGEANDGRLRVSCECGTKFRVKRELLGKKIKCPKCNTSITVADDGASSQSSITNAQPATTVSGRIARPQLPVAIKFTEIAAALESLPPEISQPKELKEKLGARKLKSLTTAIEKKDGEGKPEAEQRRQSILELGKTEDSRVVDLLVPLASDYWISVREAVAEALGTAHDPKGVPTLIKLLDDEVPEVRRKAVVALGEIGDARAVPALLTLALQEPLFRFTAGESIAKIGSAAVPALIQQLKGDDPSLALEAIVVLAKIKDPASTDAVVGVLGHKFAILRSHAAETLGAIKDAKAAPALLKALGDPDAVVRANAISAIQKLGDKRAVRPLMQLVADTDADVSLRAASALGELGDVQAASSLIPLLERPEPEVRAAGAEALGKLGDEIAAEPLTQLLYDADENVRLKAVSAFRKFKTATAVAPLLSLLDDPNIQIRQRSVDALGETGNAIAVDRLITVLKSDSAVEVRMSAAKSLGLLRSPKAISALEEALDDDFTVRCRAIAALGDIGDLASLPALLAMLRDPVPEVRYHASQSLAEIGHGNARRPLEDLLGDENPMVRRGAAKALIKLGDPRGEKLLEEASKKRKKPATGTIVDYVPDWLIGLLMPTSAGGQLVAIGVPAVLFLVVGIWFIGPAMISMLKPAQRVVVRGRPSSVSISADSKLAAIGRSRGMLEVYDIPTAKLLKRLVSDSAAAISGVAMGPDGKTIYLTYQSNVRRYVNDKPEELTPHPTVISYFLVSSDNRRGVTFSADGTVYLWDLEAGKVLNSLLIDASTLTSLAFCDDGSLLAWGTKDGQVSVFDTEKNAVRVQFDTVKAPINSLAISNKGLVAAAGPEIGLVAWDSSNKTRILKNLTNLGKTPEPEMLNFRSQDEELFARQGANFLHINIKDEKIETVADSSKVSISMTAVNADASLVVSAFSDEFAAYAIDLKDGTLKATLDAK